MSLCSPNGCEAVLTDLSLSSAVPSLPKKHFSGTKRRESRMNSTKSFKEGMSYTVDLNIIGKLAYDSAIDIIDGRLSVSNGF
jgi:hypothetical protein